MCLGSLLRSKATYSGLVGPANETKSAAIHSCSLSSSGTSSGSSSEPASPPATKNPRHKQQVRHKVLDVVQISEKVELPEKNSTAEWAVSNGLLQHIQQLLADMRAGLKPSQERGPTRRDTDLTDRLIQGIWVDSSRRCAHSALQRRQLRSLIKMDHMTRANPGQIVQPTGKFKFCNASKR